MEFFDDGTANGGTRNSKAERAHFLLEMYAANAENKARRDELVKELRKLNRNIAELDAIISETEAYDV